MYLILLFSAAAVAYVKFRAADAGMGDLAWARQAAGKAYVKLVRGKVTRAALAVRSAAGAKGHKRTRSEATGDVGEAVRGGAAGLCVSLFPFRGPRFARSRSPPLGRPSAAQDDAPMVLQTEYGTKPNAIAEGDEARRKRRSALLFPCSAAPPSPPGPGAWCDPGNLLLPPLRQEASPAVGSPAPSPPPVHHAPPRAGPNPALMERRIIPVCFALYSAAPGTFTVVFSKIVALFIRITTSGEQNMFARFDLYLYIVLLVVTGVWWDKQMNAGLRLFPAVVIMPVMQVAWTVLCILDGGIFFQEFADLPEDGKVFFILGLLIVLSGMGLLIPKPKKKQQEAGGGGSAVKQELQQRASEGGSVPPSPAPGLPSPAAPAGGSPLPVGADPGRKVSFSGAASSLARGPGPSSHVGFPCLTVC